MLMIIKHAKKKKACKIVFHTRETQNTCSNWLPLELGQPEWILTITMVYHGVCVCVCVCLSLSLSLSLSLYVCTSYNLSIEETFDYLVSTPLLHSIFLLVVGTFFIGLVYQGKDIVFKFIIEYSIVA
jgi:hypothetical protein